MVVRGWGSLGLLHVLVPLRVVHGVAGKPEFILQEVLNQAGLEEFLERYMEPGGSACVAYLDRNSNNHFLMKKLHQLAEEQTDMALHTLQIPIALALDWSEEDGNEMLIIHRRVPFTRLWEMESLPYPDNSTTRFSGKPDEEWRESEVRKWLLANAYPLINTRNLDPVAKYVFPEARYLGEANSGGLGLIVANLSGDLEFSAQYRLMKMLRPHAEKWRDRLRFSFLERSKKTSTLRYNLGVGMDGNFSSELLVIKDVNWKPESKELNYLHGRPGKYRLQNLTQASVDAFFEDFEKGTLPTFWASKENWTFTTGQPPKGEFALRITGPSFEEVVYEQDPGRHLFLAFFNDDPEDGCQTCERSRAIWEEVAREVASRKALRTKVRIAAIDQSLNEHPESRIPGKLGEPLLMWYPPGLREVRAKGSKNLEAMAALWTKEALLSKIDDLLMDYEADAEEEAERAKAPKKRRRRGAGEGEL
uniref:Thioredoxin domain-containing protein n=1 Tax=Pyrodinium bahamense TaxID=73915 RepID=A0A7S0FTI4_9DINO